ncbi:hypothetical protein PSP6_160200 [Paraburkholderia tropica]|nr:hypothetical protein PSP6_160200 [Paraburkholderia tropica]
MFIGGTSRGDTTSTASTRLSASKVESVSVWASGCATASRVASASAVEIIGGRGALVPAGLPEFGTWGVDMGGMSGVLGAAQTRCTPRGAFGSGSAVIVAAGRRPCAACPYAVNSP